MANDPFLERESDRLQSQLKSGCHIRIYHRGESPAFAFLPARPSTATQVRHQVAESLLYAGGLRLVENGWNFDVYALAA